MQSLTGTLTDGFDSGSWFTWRQAVDQAFREDTAIYAIIGAKVIFLRHTVMTGRQG